MKILSLMPPITNGCLIPLGASQLVALDPLLVAVQFVGKVRLHSGCTSYMFPFISDSKKLSCTQSEHIHPRHSTNLILPTPEQSHALHFQNLLLGGVQQTK